APPWRAARRRALQRARALPGGRAAGSRRGRRGDAASGAIVAAMPRWITVAAAQLGPINEGTGRSEVVERMSTLLEQAVRQGVELLVYREMALTPSFPKRVRDDYDHFFETEVPPKALEPLLRAAGRAGVACHVGFCEKAGARRFNTALLSDERGEVVGT